MPKGFGWGYSYCLFLFKIYKRYLLYRIKTQSYDEKLEVIKLDKQENYV